MSAGPLAADVRSIRRRLALSSDRNPCTSAAYGAHQAPSLGFACQRSTTSAGVWTDDVLISSRRWLISGLPRRSRVFMAWIPQPPRPIQRSQPGGASHVSMPARIRCYLLMLGLTAAFHDGALDCPGRTIGGTRARGGAPFARSDATGAGGPCGPTWTIQDGTPAEGLASDYLRVAGIGRQARRRSITLPVLLRRRALHRAEARLLGHHGSRGGARPRHRRAHDGSSGCDHDGLPQARLFLCAAPDCRAQALICSHCDRGHIYCANCGPHARRRSLHAAGRRYQASHRGRAGETCGAIAPPPGAAK